MLRRVKSVLFMVLVLNLIVGCTAPVQIITAVPELKLPHAILPALIADPAEVVQGFWEAMNARDLEGALTFMAEDVQCRGACYLNSKEAVQSLIQGMFKLVLVAEVKIHDLQVEGDTVNYLIDWYRNDGGQKASNIKEVMRVQNGRIIYWELFE